MNIVFSNVANANSEQMRNIGRCGIILSCRGEYNNFKSGRFIDKWLAGSRRMRKNIRLIRRREE